VIRVDTIRWRCSPVIAACQIESEAWVMAPPVIAVDLQRDKELHKVIRVSTRAEDRDLIYVVCTSDGDSETLVEFLLYDDLSPAEVGIARDFIVRVKHRAQTERLTPRKIGFIR
jgi:hypothetical protein